MKTVLVTGGAGYIGSHTCKVLAEAGYTPVTFDNLVYGHQWAVNWGPFVKGDLLNSLELDEAFKTFNPDAVLHFAAFAYVGESVENPGKYYRNNVSGTINLLEAMRRHECHHIVFSSTCAIYGNPETETISEEHPQRPINPYGRGKLMIEEILKDYRNAYGTNYSCLRYFNAAGADPDGELGEDHLPETHLIPRAIFAALGMLEEIRVFGTDYPTPDGTAIRDYIHVTDLAKAHVLALERLQSEREPLCLNLGTGSGHSVLEVLEIIERISGRKVPAIRDTRRPGDPPVLVAAADRAREKLSWEPVLSSISNIIDTAWKWHIKHTPTSTRQEEG
jgi:UDP-arabinose 4-epimerase